MFVPREKDSEGLSSHGFRIVKKGTSPMSKENTNTGSDSQNTQGSSSGNSHQGSFFDRTQLGVFFSGNKEAQKKLQNIVKIQKEEGGEISASGSQTANQKAKEASKSNFMSQIIIRRQMNQSKLAQGQTEKPIDKKALVQNEDSKGKSVIAEKGSLLKSIIPKSLGNEEESASSSFCDPYEYNEASFNLYSGLKPPVTETLGIENLDTLASERDKNLSFLGGIGSTTPSSFFSNESSHDCLSGNNSARKVLGSLTQSFLGYDHRQMPRQLSYAGLPRENYSTVRGDGRPVHYDPYPPRNPSGGCLMVSHFTSEQLVLPLHSMVTPRQSIPSSEEGLCLDRTMPGLGGFYCEEGYRSFSNRRYSNVSNQGYRSSPSQSYCSGYRPSTGRRKCKIDPDSTLFDVDVDRIKECGKTTLMVRNIPNKYTQDMMIQMINERFRGTYDFFYLPIDFTVSPLRLGKRLGKGFNRSRTTAMSAMHSLILSTLTMLRSFSLPFTG
jgi:RNA recognition motif 2